MHNFKNTISIFWFILLIVVWIVVGTNKHLSTYLLRRGTTYLIQYKKNVLSRKFKITYIQNKVLTYKIKKKKTTNLYQVIIYL